MIKFVILYNKIVIQRKKGIIPKTLETLCYICNEFSIALHAVHECGAKFSIPPNVPVRSFPSFRLMAAFAISPTTTTIFTPNNIQQQKMVNFL